MSAHRLTRHRHLRRGVGLVLAATLVALTVTVVDAVSGPAPRAAALAPFDCPNVYSLQGRPPRNVWEVDVSTGTQSPVGSAFSITGNDTQNLNGLGISADGRHAIGVIPDASGTGRSIYRYDRETDSTTLLGTGVASAATTHGAIDPATGIYYYGGVTTGTLNVYGFDPATGSSLGRVATGPVPNNGGNGDFAFDRRGRLYVVAGNAGNSVFSVVDQRIPTTSSEIAITATQIADIPAPEAINGIAYSGTGYLYVSSAGTIYQINPGSGAVVDSNAFTQVGSVDLGSCATPSTVAAQGSFPGGRVAAGDQVTLTVSGGGLPAGKTATTSGSESGPQTQPGEVVGPLPGLTGNTYTVTASGSGVDPAKYDLSWQCIDENDGGAVVAQGTGATGSFSMPDAGAEGSSVLCTMTSSAKQPAVGLDKQAGDLVDADSNGPDAGDTVDYRFVVTNTGDVPLASVSVTDAMVGAVTCPAGALAPTESKTCTAAPYSLTQADVDRGRVDNTATATGRPSVAGFSDVTSAPDSTSTPVPGRARLVLDKVAGTPTDVNDSGHTDAGDTIAYTFEVTNGGNVTVRDLTVDDPRVASVSCPSTTLAPGASTTCTAPAYTVTPADEAAGSVDNTATARGTDARDEAVASEPDSTSTPVPTADAALVLDKRAGTPTDVNGSGITDAGDTIGYTFTVTNEGNVTVRDVVVHDDLVGSVTCDATILAPSASTECAADAVYVVTADDEAAGLVTNTAYATGTEFRGGNVTSLPDSTESPVTAPAPSLTLDKREGSPVDVNASGITDAGDTIAYTFTVTNDGNVGLTGVAVADPLVGAVTCDATTLAPTESTECAADDPYVVTAADEDAERVLNTATASGADPDGDPVESAPDQTSTPVETPAPALLLDKYAASATDTNGSGITDAGDTVVYTFTVTNTGNVPVDSLEVVDPKAGAVTCDRTRLGPTDETDCAADDPYVVTPGDELAGEVHNVARAEGRDPDGRDVLSADDSTSTPVTPPAPALTLEKRAGTPVDANHSGITDAGDTIAFTFTVTNSGNVPVAAVGVTDPLAGPVSCDTTSLAPTEAAQCAADAAYVVTDADEDAGVVVNTAMAAATDPDGGDVVADPDSTSTPVSPQAPALVLDKQAGTPADVDRSGLTDAGDTIRYTFTVTNEGNVPVSQVAVDDPLVGGVTCPATTLAPGAATRCAADAAYVVTAADAEAGEVVNVAAATAEGPDGDPVASNEDTTTTPVEQPRAVLELEKWAGEPVDEVDDDRVGAGDTILYRFMVTNAGNVWVDGLVVEDPKLTGVSCVDDRLAPSEMTLCHATEPYVITEREERAGRVDNTASAYAAGVAGLRVSAPRDSVTTPVTVPADGTDQDPAGVAAEERGTDDVLPDTGGPSRLLPGAALLLLAAGGYLVVTGRRRAEGR